MTDPCALPRGGGGAAAAPVALTEGLFPAASLAPARWLGAGQGVRGTEKRADVQDWHPDLPFHGAGEVFAPGNEAAGAALALALAQSSPRRPLSADRLSPQVHDERCFLWVQDRAAMRRGGRPYLPGLPRALRHRMIHVAARDAAEALFALEEGVRCCDLAFVIGEIAGNPIALDFTASRRLVLAAERHGVPLWLVRGDARRDLGAARLRWQAESAPSLPSRWDAQAPGAPRWRADLFRARGLRPGTWWITREEEGDGPHHKAPHIAAARSDAPPDAASPGIGDLAAPAGDRSLAAAAFQR